MDFDPNLVIVGAPIVPIPALTALVQDRTYVKAIVTPPPLTGTRLFTFLRIYRAPSAIGPWKFVDGIPPSPISVQNNLFDLDPAIGHQTFYCATASDSLGVESVPSAVLSISALAT